MNQSFEQNETTKRASETKDRILDAAERLFAANGLAATSLRQITTEAGVNLAAVNYHFQSKDQLIFAVLLRHIGPINQRRLELLDEVEAEAKASERPLSLEAVLSAFLLPIFEAKDRGAGLCAFPRLMGRIYTEPGDWFQRVFPVLFGEVVQRFLAATIQAVPGARQPQIGWGLHFTVGVMAHYLVNSTLLNLTTGGQAPPARQGDMLPSMITYMSAGIRALINHQEGVG